MSQFSIVSLIYSIWDHDVVVEPKFTTDHVLLHDFLFYNIPFVPQVQTNYQVVTLWLIYYTSLLWVDMAYSSCRWHGA